MIHLIYISSATSLPTENDLKELLVQSRDRNKRQNITGMLLYDNMLYMQVLEGSAKDVHDIYNAIQNDPRNTAVITLTEEEITQRDFPTWRMGFKNLASCLPEELPGFADIFNGKLDKASVIANKTIAANLLRNFAELVK